jgi:hypothetical protein
MQLSRSLILEAILYRAAGPYILALLRPTVMRRGGPLAGVIWTLSRHHPRAEFDLLRHRPRGTRTVLGSPQLGDRTWWQ